MNTKKKRGRPMLSNRVRVIPEFREHPDVEKLTRALIGIATDMARKEAEAAKAKMPQTAMDEAEDETK